MMTDSGSLNREILEGVARCSQPLLEEVVFVGGQVAKLLITSPGATRVRPTTDVDIVVRASTRLGYREVDDRLRSMGLKNDIREGAPICRYESVPCPTLMWICDGLVRAWEWRRFTRKATTPSALSQMVTQRRAKPPIPRGTRHGALCGASQKTLPKEEPPEPRSVASSALRPSLQQRAAPRRVPRGMGGPGSQRKEASAGGGT